MRLAVVAGPAPGHVFPAAALARGLAGRGHEVTVLTGREWLEPLRRDGLPARPLPGLGREAVPATPEQVADFGWRLWGQAREMAPALHAALVELGAEAVVADTLTVAGQFAAELAGLPWAELVPHPLQDPSPYLPVPGSGLAPARTPLGRARDRWMHRAHARSRALGAGQRAAARAGLGLTLAERRAGRVVATLPGLEPPRPDWPADTVVVGPLEWDPAEAELALPAGDAPLVALSESTAGRSGLDSGPRSAGGESSAGRAGRPGPDAAGGVAGELLEPTLAACAALGLRLAATRLEPYAGALPPWASAGPGRQDAVLAAADVVVCGAGHGILAKALARGRPVLTVPGAGEQWDNACRVRRLGAGLVLRPGQVDAERLRRALRRLLTRPGYAAAARRVGASGAGLGPAYAAECVERMLAGERVG